MSWQYTPYALGSLLTAVVAGGLCVYALRRRGTPGARMGALFMAAVSLWATAYAVELSVTGLPAHLFWSRVSYLGIVVVPPAWFGFAAAYTGREGWLSRRNLVLLAVVPVLTLALLFTNGAHHLYWSETRLNASGPVVVLEASHGPAFWVWLAYAYALLGVGAVLVVSMLARSGTLYGRQGWALLFGAAAPWVGNALYIFGPSPVPGLDPTPFCFLLTCVAMAIAIARFGLLDVVPVARAAVVEEMGDGVIVLDAKNRVLDLNPAARRLCRLPASKAIGLPADEVISSEEILREVYGGDGVRRREVRVPDGDDGHRDYEVTVSPLRRSRRQAVRFVVVRDVTERVERELLFRLIVENASDVVTIYEPDAEFRYVSPSVWRVLGYDPEEAIKLGSAREVVHPEDAEEALARFEEIWSHPGVSPPIQFRMRHKEGSWRHMEAVCNNLLHDPEVRGVVAAWRDVTGRVEAEEEVRRLNRTLEGQVAERTRRLEAIVAELRESERALMESEERYQRLYEASLEGLAIHEGGTILEANDAIAAMFGYGVDEFVGTNALEHVAPESREELKRNMLSGYEGQYEAIGIKKDGTRILVEIRGRPSLYRGRPVRLTAMRDVTNLRRQERALRESEAKYRAIFENAVEGIFQSTADGRLVTANPAMARIFGYDSPEELLQAAGDVAEGLYARPEQRAEFAEATRERGAVAGFEVEVKRRDGGRAWVSVSARALYDEEGGISGYEGSLEDVTGRFEARRTLERRVAALTRIASTLTLDEPTGARLDALAAGVVETTAALACSVYLIDPGRKELLLAGLSGLPEGYADAVRSSWRAGRASPALRSFESGSPVLVRDGRRTLLANPSYAPIYHPLREARWDAIHAIPLIARGEALGTIATYYPSGEEPTGDEEAFLQAVADQAALAVENGRLYAAAGSAAALQERQRLSRELHDSVSQALYGIALGSRTARTLLDCDPTRAAAPLEYVLSLAEAGLAEMRALIFELRPEALETEGLVSALERQAAALRARHGINVHTTLPDEPDLPPERKEALYRVAQEAMHNAVKHSGASNVDLSMQLTPGEVLLSVADDGVGFDASGAFPGHLGLRSMRERTERLGGTLSVESAPGGGARIHARIPL